MADTASLTTQTIYAELVDRCTSAAFEAEFPLNGSFVRVPVKDRVYWYFQKGTRDASGKQPRKYVGTDTPEIQQRIAKHGQAKDDYRQRRHLVATLRREGFRGPLEDAGRVLQALSAAGIFRMRACIVGTSAYQVYGPMLGVRLPHATLQTGDLDIAQFTSVSLALSKDEQTPALLEILQQADPSFRPVPHVSKNEATVAYINRQGFRVEVLTENRGPEGDTPRRLPALGTHAQPLRFLDFLIYDEIPSVVLHNGGVLVNVPPPARYALHKLIVAQRRKEGATKIDKDIQQADALLDVLAKRRSGELREVWREAIARGKKWAELLASGLAKVSPKTRDRALHVFGATRSILPGHDIRFSDAPPRYDFNRDAVVFQGDAGGEQVLCAISREALEDHFGADDLTPEQRMKTFRRHRDEIQGMARLIYLNRIIPEDGTVLITTADVEPLRKNLKLKARAVKRRGA